MQNDNDIHKEPLRTDGSPVNTGLERSYSSPNLLQVRKHSRVVNPLVNQSGFLSFNLFKMTKGKKNLIITHVSA